MNSLYFLCFPLLYLLLFHQKCVLFYNKLGLFLKLLPVEKQNESYDWLDSFICKSGLHCYAKLLATYFSQISKAKAKQLHRPHPIHFTALKADAYIFVALWLHHFITKGIRCLYRCLPFIWAQSIGAWLAEILSINQMENVIRARTSKCHISE